MASAVILLWPGPPPGLLATLVWPCCSDVMVTLSTSHDWRKSRSSGRRFATAPWNVGMVNFRLAARGGRLRASKPPTSALRPGLACRERVSPLASRNDLLLVTGHDGQVPVLHSLRPFPDRLHWR